jgi:hypothetical protein
MEFASLSKEGIHDNLSPWLWILFSFVNPPSDPILLIQYQDKIGDFIKRERRNPTLNLFAVVELAISAFARTDYND